MNHNKIVRMSNSTQAAIYLIKSKLYSKGVKTDSHIIKYAIENLFYELTGKTIEEYYEGEENE